MLPPLRIRLSSNDDASAATELDGRSVHAMKIMLKKIVLQFIDVDHNVVCVDETG